MRRIDILAISLGIFLVGGLLYGGFKVAGLESLDAGIWSQALLVLVVFVWVGTYLFRVGTRTMTFHKQRADYEEAALQRRLDAMSPEELAQLQAEIEAAEEKSAPKK
ncbi:hypothetical protein NIES970_10510 [[Synechococcus] sp. NIES-970]|uniref:DUF3007 family protein n=1 Tax=Picosynechococcus sp. NKBG15041c TaxID=1407650 RepID=UPI000407045A|nr:DUF3007 family protein [Picosynechococcus sp. NKBG15041c]BAW96128.1 hypothetical protein NIES970_10510 [[Synechococcus] sp. NIES-970]